MKLLRRYSDKDIKIIDIEIILEYEYSHVAASDGLLNHPKNIKRRRRISDIKLQILNDVAASAKSRIETSEQFVVTYETPAGKNKDYTYYIQFDVYDKEGNKLIPVGIRFRISNHTMKGEETPIDSNTVVIRSFVLKGKNYDNSVAIIQTINMICSELERGNIKILDQYTY